jgi:hypothetical protein
VFSVSFCVYGFGTFGLCGVGRKGGADMSSVTCFGQLQVYYLAHQLEGYSKSTVS